MKSTPTVRLIGTLGACLLIGCTATPLPAPGSTATPAPTAASSSGPTPTTQPSVTAGSFASPGGAASSDGDGVADGTEAQASGRNGSALGDGNADGMPDAQQANVASLQADDGSAYVTFAVEPGLTLVGVRSVDATALALPDRTTLPYGAFDFAVEGLSPGQTIDLSIFLPSAGDPGIAADTAVTTYLMASAQGPTAMVPFGWDGASGTRVDSSGKLGLRLVDGGRGDADARADGRIVDPGAPAAGPDPPPVAKFIWGRGSHPWALLVDGSSSYDPLGSVVSVEWEWGDGDSTPVVSCPDGRCSGTKGTHEYKADSTYDVTLTVTDDAGGAGVSTVAIVVPEPFEVECVPGGPTRGPTPLRVGWKIETSWDKPSNTPFGPLFPYGRLVHEVRFDTGEGVTDKTDYWESSFINWWQQVGDHEMTTSFEIINPATNQIGIAASCGFVVNVEPLPVHGLTGTLTWHEDFVMAHGGDRSEHHASMTINVRMTPDLPDPDGVSWGFVDDGSTYTYAGSGVYTVSEGCGIEQQWTEEGGGALTQDFALISAGFAGDRLDLAVHGPFTISGTMTFRCQNLTVPAEPGNPGDHVAIPECADAQAGTIGIEGIEVANGTPRRFDFTCSQHGAVGDSTITLSGVLTLVP